MTIHNIAANLDPNFTLSQHPKPKFLGHRGARGEQLENSQKGFLHSQALQQQAARDFVGIEFDVQLTADGQLIVFHDDNLLRLYRSQVRVDQTAYKTLQRLSASTNPILLLANMPPLLTGYTRIELEVKTHQRTHYPNLLAALARTLTLPEFDTIAIVLTSFDIELLQRLQAHKILSTFNRGLLVEPIISNTDNSHPRLVSDADTAADADTGTDNAADVNVADIKSVYRMPYIATRLGCTGVGFYYSLYNQKVMTLCQRLGLSTSAWTVNSRIEVKRLSHLGVDYIITDYPSRFIRACRTI